MKKRGINVMQAKLAERKKKFDNNFDVITHNFEKSSGTTEHKAVICNNVQNVIDQACEYRNIDKERYENIIGWDSGQDILKVTLSIVKKITSSNDVTESILDDENNDTDNDKKDNFKSSGVKKVLILAAVKGVPETYNKILLSIWLLV